MVVRLPEHFIGIDTVCIAFSQCIVSAFFCDLDPYPGKNLHADPDPDPGGKNDIFFFVFFTFQMILNNLKKNL